MYSCLLKIKLLISIPIKYRLKLSGRILLLNQNQILTKVLSILHLHVCQLGQWLIRINQFFFRNISNLTRVLNDEQNISLKSMYFNPFGDNWSFFNKTKKQ